MRMGVRATLGFLYREVADLARQRTLVVLTVLGPFLILLAFGAGYRDERLVLRTLFVGPEDQAYEDLLARYQDRFGEFIAVAGYTSDLPGAHDELEQGAVDAVIVFPRDPLAAVLAGESARVTVIHDELNPIQEVAIGFAIRIATDKVNQAMVEQLFVLAQDEARPVVETLAGLDRLRQQVRVSGPQQQEAVEALAASLRQLRTQAAALEAFGALYGGAGDDAGLSSLRQQLDATQQALQQLADDEWDEDDLQRFDSRFERLQQAAELVSRVDPSVLARPFVSTTESLSTVNIDATEFFGASAVALLLQHLAMSFGALTFVRDRSMGLLELLRVGPVGAAEALLGKLLAFSMVGGAVGAALIVAAHELLEVPLLGDLGWLVGIVALLLVASIALGFVLSLLSRTDTQAVQYAMLVLLASLFFSGFFIDHERFQTATSAAARLLPVTSAINGIQDVMLRGRVPDPIDVASLAVLAVGGLTASWLLLRHELRTA